MISQLELAYTIRYLVKHSILQIDPLVHFRLRRHDSGVFKLAKRGFPLVV